VPWEWVEGRSLGVGRRGNLFLRRRKGNIFLVLERVYGRVGAVRV
jgi:hypothetical protein